VGDGVVGTVLHTGFELILRSVLTAYESVDEIPTCKSARLVAQDRLNSLSGVHLFNVNFVKRLALGIGKSFPQICASKKEGRGALSNRTALEKMMDSWGKYNAATPKTVISLAQSQGCGSTRRRLCLEPMRNVFSTSSRKYPVFGVVRSGCQQIESKKRQLEDNSYSALPNYRDGPVML
jgi:hypothetical protein